MYSQEITRRHRTAFVIAIDQSGSMQEKVCFGRHEMSKAAAVARITNSLLTELVDRSRRTDGVRNYYDVAVVGYSGDEARMLLDEEGFIAIDRLARRQPPCETLYSEETLPDSTSPAMVFPMPDELARANPYARLLAECSSIMPEAFDEAVRDFKGAGAVPPFYGMGYNTSIIELLSIINIGSRSITNIE